MNFSDIFSKFRTGKGAGRFSKPSRDQLLVWGTIICMLLFGGFLAFDGYTFYILRFEANSFTEPAASKKMLSQEDIITTIKMLDGREKKFQEISTAGVAVKNPPTASTTLPINLLLPQK